MCSTDVVMKSVTLLFMAVATLTAVVIGDSSSDDTSESRSNDVEDGAPDTTDGKRKTLSPSCFGARTTGKPRT